MRALHQLNPGKKSTRKFMACYSEPLSGVCSRYDVAQRKRFTTVELIVEEADPTPPEMPTVIGVRVERQEVELQRKRAANGIRRSGCGRCSTTKRSHWD